MAKKSLVVGNWKMYIGKLDDAKALALLLRRKLRGVAGFEVYVAPPLTMLPKISELLESSPIYVGAQAVSAHTTGAHTGEVSALMLKAAGASFVIIGHSERRAAGDTSEAVHAQLVQAVEAGLTPLLCIGEESRGQDGEYFSYIEAQLQNALKSVPKNILKKLVVAYEPVWAIGKSAEEAMKPADLREMAIFIRKVLAGLVGREAALKVSILYGGSVEAENAAALMQEGGVNGFLVGRASTHADSFLAIIEACKK